MKKLLFLLLCAAVAVSVSAGLTKVAPQKTIGMKTAKKVESIARGQGHVTSAAIQFDNWSKKTSHFLRSDAAITWDFETQAQFEEFMAVDNDEDGFNWQYFNNEGLTSGLMSAHGGYGLVASASYDNDSGTALSPDNWLVSPEVTLGGALTLWACGQDQSYNLEKFGVYVCIGDPEGPESFVKVGPDFTTSGDYAEFEFDLSAYQGQVGHFAIVHHNVTDMFWLNIDDITLDVGAVALPYPVVPTVTVTPDVTSAMVNWGADEGATAYDLRWRPWTDTSAGGGVFWDFKDADYPDFLEDWYTVNADEDTLNWTLYYTSSAYDDLCWGSESWNSGVGGFTPDNWLITPETKLEGTLSFNLCGYYEDYISVYALVGWDPSNGYAPAEEDLILLESFTTDGSGDFVPTSVDLSSLNGAMGRIVFRHYNCYDQFRVYIDDIQIGVVIPEAEWTYAYDITDNFYKIEGLTPETKYEVQVMGKNADHESDWCDIVEFTTLAETPVIPDLYILGEVNDKTWAANDGLLMTYDAENDVYTATVNFDGRGESGENYFSFTTELANDNDEGGWAYIEGFRIGADSEGESDFWYDDMYDGQALSLVHGKNAFRIMNGDYNLTVSLTNMTLTITRVVPAYLRGDVDMSGEVKIADVTALINYLLTGNDEGISLLAADCDENGEIKIADVTTLINYLLTGSWPE